jgi:hypothetical protein
MTFCDVTSNGEDTDPKPGQVCQLGLLPAEFEVRQSPEELVVTAVKSPPVPVTSTELLVDENPAALKLIVVPGKFNVPAVFPIFTIEVFVPVPKLRVPVEVRVSIVEPDVSAKLPLESRVNLVVPEDEAAIMFPVEFS